MFININKISNNINMEYSKDKKNIDFELDLTSDNQIHYVESSEKEKELHDDFHKYEINFINKLIDFGFFLSGFVLVYTILKIKNNHKKIKYKEPKIEKIYYKKIYKKNKINYEGLKEL